METEAERDAYLAERKKREIGIIIQVFNGPIPEGPWRLKYFDGDGKETDYLGLEVGMVIDREDLGLSNETLMRRYGMPSLWPLFNALREREEKKVAKGKTEIQGA